MMAKLKVGVTIKKTIKNYKNRFLLKLINWGDADMINIFDDNDNLILPHAAKNRVEKPMQDMKTWGCNFSILFLFSSILQTRQY